MHMWHQSVSDQSSILKDNYARLVMFWPEYFYHADTLLPTIHVSHAARIAAISPIISTQTISAEPSMPALKGY